MKNLKEIPDRNFRKKLKEFFPAAFEDELLDINNEKIVNCKKLFVTYLNILDLTGIEWFVNLEELYCFNNQLTSLPNLPKTLEYLDCSNNQLTSLPELPNKLITLGCYENNLTTLPELPNRLEYLNCRNNQLTTLPKLPKKLKHLYCHYNRFTNNENIFIDSEGRVIVKQNDIFFAECKCNKTATEAKKLCLEHGYNEAIKYFSL